MQNSLILSVETSSRIGSVAIASGCNLLAEITFSDVMRHSIEIFPAIQKLLDMAGKKPCNIEQIYISAGPGSFTGLRIAVTLAKMMSFACDVKIVAVDTLDVIAENINDYMQQDKQSVIDIQPDRIAPVLDAKRGQFFTAIYKLQCKDDEKAINNGQGEMKYKKIVSDCIIGAADFINRYVKEQEPLWLLGDGLVYHKDKFNERNIYFLDSKYWRPQAAKVHKLGWKKALCDDFIDAVNLVPVYLCRPQITMKKA